MAALVDQVQVDLAERGEEPVGVVDDDLALPVVDRDPVAGHVPVGGDDARPDATVLVLEPVVDVADADRDRRRQGLEHPDGDDVVVQVRAEDGVRVPVLAADELVELAPGDRVDGVDGTRRCGGHQVPIVDPEILASPASGMSTHDGRFRVS